MHHLTNKNKTTEFQEAFRPSDWPLAKLIDLICMTSMAFANANFSVLILLIDIP